MFSSATRNGNYGIVFWQKSRTPAENICKQMRTLLSLALLINVCSWESFRRDVFTFGWFGAVSEAD